MFYNCGAFWYAKTITQHEDVGKSIVYVNICKINVDMRKLRYFQKYDIKELSCLFYRNIMKMICLIAKYAKNVIKYISIIERIQYSTIFNLIIETVITRRHK